MRARRAARACAIAVLSFRQSAWSADSPDPIAKTETAAAGATPSGDIPSVTVHGTRARPPDIGAEEAPARDLRDVAGTFGEPFQALASLPGVAATVSGLPYFYVRGAPPADTGYYLDGIPLPTLFHVGPGPSVVPAAIVGQIAFFPGAAPARFGRYVGGVIAADTLAPSSAARGELSLRWFDSSAFLESPLGDGWTALVAGRYGYPGPVLEALHSDVSLSYGDYTARVSKTLSERDRVTLFAMGGFDTERNDLGFFPVSTRFHRVDLRFDHSFQDGTLRVATTLGYDRTEHPFTDGENAFVTSTSMRLRAEFEKHLGRLAHLSAGADFNVAHQSSTDTGLSEISPLQTQQLAGAYVDLKLRPAPGIALQPGLRVDVYRAGGGVIGAVDPRLAARFELHRTTTAVSTFGMAHQQPTFVIPIPGLGFDPGTGLQEVVQLAQGIELVPVEGASLSVTGFYNANHRTSDFIGSCGTQTAISCDLVGRVDGQTVGLEVLLRRPLTDRLGGWISYTLSRADRTIGGKHYLSPLDRTHVLSATLRYDFGDGYAGGFRATYEAGRPDFPSVTFGSGAGSASFGPSYAPQHRLPGFFRLDLRAERRWTFGARAWMAVVLDFFNVTFAREAVGFQCVPLSPSGTPTAAERCTPQSVGPVALPSLGLEAGF